MLVVTGIGQVVLLWESSQTVNAKANTNTLAAIFHNGLYAGWVTSKIRTYRPKQFGGSWEPLVTTENLSVESLSSMSVI